MTAGDAKHVEALKWLEQAPVARWARESRVGGGHTGR